MPIESKLDPKALETLLALEQESPGSFSEFVRMFVTEAPELVKKMEAAHATGDAEALGQSAHYLRSAAMAMGATTLADACHRLEHLDAGNYPRADVESRMLELRHAVRNALIALLQQVAQI